MSVKIKQWYDDTCVGHQILHELKLMANMLEDTKSVLKKEGVLLKDGLIDTKFLVNINYWICVGININTYIIATI